MRLARMGTGIPMPGRSSPVQPGRAVRLRRRAQLLLREHPRTGLALKTAVAAAVAWELVQPFGGFVEEYPYYAPLGAVVVMGTAVVDSVRSTVQAVGAILLGAALALLVSATPGPTAVLLAAAVVAATLLAGSPWLGAMGSWVPFAAVFTLVVGREDPWHYVAAYAGLTAVGAVVGTAVNLLVPQLPLTRTSRVEAALRREIVRQLKALAEQVRSAEPFPHQSWAMVPDDLSRRSRQLDQLVSEVAEARRGNWRAGGWTGWADRSQRQGRALQTIAGIVSDLTKLVAVDLREGADEPDRFLAGLGDALEAVADMLHTSGEPFSDLDVDEDAVQTARDAADRVRSTVLDHRDDPAETLLVRASIVTALERCIQAWVQ